jgi:Zn-dependent M16 (insulinase) family peptidase
VTPGLKAQKSIMMHFIGIEHKHLEDYFLSLFNCSAETMKELADLYEQNLKNFSVSVVAGNKAIKDSAAKLGIQPEIIVPIKES